jgi:GTP-binding protein
VLLTKSDKLNRRDSLQVLKQTLESCDDTAVTAQLFSALAKQGIDEARERMQSWLVEPE